MSVFSELIEPKVLQILRVLIRKRGSYFHLQSLSSESHVPIATTYRIIKKLTAIGIVTVIRINKMKIYTLSKSKKADEIVSVIGGGR